MLLYNFEDIFNQLVEEFEDAVSFMETFEDAGEEYFGDEGYNRLDRKKELLEAVLQIQNRFVIQQTPITEDHEVCDKCHRLLDKTKNEDIWLEPLEMVLCGSCHSEHKGIEKYWSYRSVQEYNDENFVTEWCPHCEQEVLLSRNFERQPCSNCKVGILPCAQCETQECSKCPID